MNQFIIKFLSALIPMLVKFVPNLIDRYLLNPGPKKMDLKITVRNEEGVPLSNAKLIMQFPSIGQIIRTVNVDGEANILGVTFESFIIDIESEGYKNSTLAIVNTGEYCEHDVVLSKCDSGKSVKTITRAKEVYEDNRILVKQSKTSIQQALQEQAYDIIQEHGSDLVSVVNRKLTESADFYKDSRIKLKPFNSLGDLKKYFKYTAMLIGNYLIQKDLVLFLKLTLEKILNLSVDKKN